MFKEGDPRSPHREGDCVRTEGSEGVSLWKAEGTVNMSPMCLRNSKEAEVETSYGGDPRACGVGVQLG